MERLDIEPAAASQKTFLPTSKSSLVSALLETVDGAIKNSATEADAQDPLPSSPSPRKRSPRKVRAEAHSGPSLPPDATTVEGRLPEPISSPTDRQAYASGAERQEVTEKPSSDYGDDDFDDDTLMELDASVKPARVEDTTFVGVEEPVPPPLAPPNAGEDEFGDFDDDLFDAAEELVVAVESERVSGSSVAGQRHDRPNIDVGGEEEDDPYGDDFGDELDLDAIELAATQSAMHASAFPHVRTVP